MNVSIESEAEERVVVDDSVGVDALDEAIETVWLEIGMSTTPDEGLILELDCSLISVVAAVLG